mmetsp:Transcript_30346/g.76029  ORF Transcript_30346/g.76029 Transcript_30346/m.76029 type:complete len:255 (-) Transcript_30346:521-1285(-)
MSSPRAATSVATSTRVLPARKEAIVFSRACCGMSPCSAFASYLSASAVMRSSHSAFVSQKMMARPEAPAYMPITSLIVEARVDQCEGMAICRTSSEALTAESPTRSTILGLGRMYLGATSRTQAGMVAEKRQVCRSACVHLPRIALMSSAKPMSSIWSASSSVAKRTPCSLSVSRSMWSLMRPGVPTSTSTPERSDETCGPMGAPPYTQSSVMVGETVSISRPTCCASSRVGAITRPIGPWPRALVAGSSRLCL